MKKFKEYKNTELDTYFEGTGYTYERKVDDSVAVVRRGGSLDGAFSEKKVRDEIERLHKKTI